MGRREHVGYGSVAKMKIYTNDIIVCERTLSLLHPTQVPSILSPDNASILFSAPVSNMVPQHPAVPILSTPPITPES